MNKRNIKNHFSLFRALLAFVMVTITYISLPLVKPRGIFAYTYTALPWILVSLLHIDRVFVTRTSDGFDKALHLVLPYATVFAFMSAIFGLGLTPYSLHPMDIALNIYRLSLITIGIEIVRSAFIDSLGRHKGAIVSIPTLTLLQIPFLNILSIANLGDALSLITQKIIPLTMFNIMLTLVYLRYGLRACISLHIMASLISTLFPFQPLAPLFIRSVLFSMANLMSIAVLSIGALHSTESKSKRSRIELAVDFIATVFVLMVVVAMFMGYKFFVITSISMRPTLDIGDITIVEPASNPRKGDIIAYVGMDGHVVVHRVVDIRRTSEGLAFITKGDNNDVVDPEPVNMDSVIGRVALSIPRIGYPIYLAVTALKSSRALIEITATLTLLLASISYARKSYRWL